MPRRDVRDAGFATGAVALFALLALSTLVFSTCKTAPPPAPGAASGTFCGSDVECDDGLVCSCGVCATPTDVDQPPACDQNIGCPAIPTGCVQSCDNAVFIGDADCTAGVESCASGVLVTACSGCGVIPAGFRCDNGTLTCITAGNTGCLTNDCSGLTPFLCVDSCGADPFVSSCVDHAYKCDTASGFPQSQCVVDAGPDAGQVDAGPLDGGPCASDPRPLCLFDCNADAGSPPLNGAQCRAEDGGPFDWSCSGFTGYVPADRCDAGP